MGAFDFLNPSAVDDMGTYRRAWELERAMNDTLSEEVGYLRGELHEVQEDLLRISDAFDNIG